MKLKSFVEVKSMTYSELTVQAGFAGKKIVGYTVRWVDIYGNKHIENFTGREGKNIIIEARKEGLIE